MKSCLKAECLINPEYLIKRSGAEIIFISVVFPVK